MHVCMTHARWMYLWMMHMCMMHDAYIYLWSFILMHVCMMHVCMLHVSMILDPWPWCTYVWCLYLWSLILMHVCMMHVWNMLISMILDPYACISDAGFFPDRRTDERTDKPILGVGYLLMNIYRFTRGTLDESHSAEVPDVEAQLLAEVWLSDISHSLWKENTRYWPT